MEDLPSELLFLQMEMMDAETLADRCVVDRQSAVLCANKAFWQKKVRELTHREVEDDWLIPLAQMGDYRLIGYLLDAIEAVYGPPDEKKQQDPFLDQRALVLAYAYIYGRNGSYELLARIQERLNDGFINEMSYSRGLVPLLNKIQASAKNARRKWPLNDFEIGHFDPTIQTYVYDLFADSLDGLSSPSYMLAEIVALFKDAISPSYIRSSLIDRLTVLHKLLVPHLVRMGQIEPLITYRRDLIKKEELIDNINSSFIKLYDMAILANAPLETATTILGDDWSSIEDIDDIASIKCEYADTFKFIASFDPTGKSETIVEGYRSMDVEEWLEWFESLSPEMNRERIIVTSVQRAYRAGYTDFNRWVGAYAVKNGYIKKKE